MGCLALIVRDIASVRTEGLAGRMTEFAVVKQDGQDPSVLRVSNSIINLTRF
jgi:hypothetical protein